MIWWRRFSPQRVALLIIAVLAGLAPVGAPNVGTRVGAVPLEGPALELAGQVGGATEAVALDGSYAYLGVGPRLVVLSVAGASHPTVLGQSTVLGGIVHHIAVADGLAFVAAGRSLHILDLGDPTKPVARGSLTFTGEVYRVAVTGSSSGTRLAYLAAVSAGLRILDVSDPAAPREIGSYTVASGSAHAVAVSGTTAYVAFGFQTTPRYRSFSLHVLNVAAPAAPTLLGSLMAGGNPAGMTVAGEYLYLADAGSDPRIRDSGLRVIRVRDPAKPTQAGFLATETAAYDVAVRDMTAYLAVFNGLHRMSVADPAAPVALGFTPLSGARGVALAASGVYVAAGGLTILDATNTANLDVLALVALPGNAGVVTAAAGRAYVLEEHPDGFGRDLRVYDVQDPTHPVPVGFSDAPQWGLNLATAGSLLSVADGEDVKVFDVSDAAAPTQVGRADTPGSPWGVAVGGPLLAVADGPNGLTLVDVSEPSRPQVTATLPVTTFAYEAAIAGRYVYLTGSSGLHVLDAADASHPVEAGHTPPASYANDLAVAGAHAYVTTSDGLQVITLANPSAPRKVGVFPLPELGLDVAAAGSMVYIANGTRGLRVIDVSDPSQPVEVAAFDTPGHASAVAVDGPYIYVADLTGGLAVFRITRRGLPAPQLRAPESSTALPALGPVTLAWDLPAGTTQYQVQVLPANNDGPAINLIRNAEPGFTVPPPVLGEGNYLLLPGMSYVWRVRATDKPALAPEDDPAWGPWSEFWAFRTPPPTSAGLEPAFPADGATVAGVSPIRLGWTHPSANLFYWEVQVSRDARFATDPVTATSFVWWNLVHGGETTPLNSWLTPALEAGTAYFWRVRPRVQGDGIPVAWGPTWRFTTPAQRTLTPADNGATVTFLAGERFLLDLGTSYQWTVQVDDETVASPLPTTGPRAMPILFEAKRAGQTALSATGELPCHREQPPCLAPTLLFRVQLVVREPAMARQLAPIDSAEVRSADIPPREYVLDVVAGLPDSCTRYESATVQREGGGIRVEIGNTRPDGEAACAQVYGTAPHIFALGSDFTAGRTYTLMIAAPAT